MKKRMLVLSMLCAVTLGAVTTSVLSSCGTTEEQKVEVKSVSIGNKAVLEAKWIVGNADRKIELVGTPEEADVAAALSEGKIVITSSNAGVIKVSGQTLSAVASGTATISVGVKTTGKDGVEKITETDSVDLTLFPVEMTSVSISNKEKLQDKWRMGDTNRKIELTGTPEGLNIAEAVNVGQVIIASSNTEVLQVSGQYLIPVAVGTAKITISIKTTGKDGVETTTETDSIEITLEPALKANYNILSVGEIMEVDNVKTYKYIVKGKISRWQKATNTDATKYGNFYLQDETDPNKEVLVYGATATTTALTYNSADDVFAFNNPKDFLTNPVTSALTIGDTVYMEAFRCDYNGASQINGVICDSIKNVMSYENSKATAYNVVGKLTAWKDGNTDATKYGNFMLTDLADPTSTILVYGATATTTALTYDADKAVYAFKNQQDFLTNENTKNVTIGDIVALKVIRADYGSLLELTGLYLGSTAH